MTGGSDHPDSRRNFILQQGLDTPGQECCPDKFSALMFQPRILGGFVLLAVILQSPAIPFDAIYNRTLANRPGAVRLDPAPPPRRFAQGMAGSFALAIGISLLFRLGAAALVLQVLLLAALAALIFGRFCLGSFLYHLLRGRSDYAVGTLPWKPGPSPGPPSE
jgi:hypothetical protein